MTTRGVPLRGSQSSLPAEPAATDRLFLGAFPDRAALDCIERVARELPRDLQSPGAASRSSRYHVTLHHLGDYAGLAPELAEAALAAISLIQASAFDIVLDHVSSFRGRGKHPVVLRCPDPSQGVHGLWNESRAALAGAGFSRWLDGKFTPHLTLAYGGRMLSEPLPIEPITWTVDEVVLVHSLLGRSDYRVLGSRRLGSA